MSDDPVQSKRWRFTISKHLLEFPKVSCTVLSKIITERLRYHKFFISWVPKMPVECTHNAENGFSFEFLVQYHKDGDEFLDHII
jgi:hypothetical protein